METWSGRDFLSGVHQSLGEILGKDFTMTDHKLNTFKTQVTQLDLYYALRSVRDYGNWDVMVPMQMTFDETQLTSPYFNDIADDIVQAFIALSPQLISIKLHRIKTAADIVKSEAVFVIFLAYLSAFMHSLSGAMFGALLNKELDNLQSGKVSYRIHVCSPAQGILMDMFMSKLTTEEHLRFFANFISDRFRDRHAKNQHATDEEFKAALNEFEINVLNVTVLA